jgi:serine/threonine-protein kinase
MAADLQAIAAELADRYRIVRVLGAGGLATVYLADDLRHQRQVARKVLRDDLTASLGKERFLREVTIAAGLTMLDQARPEFLSQR